jgi:hypothetical protein
MYSDAGISGEARVPHLFVSQCLQYRIDACLQLLCLVSYAIFIHACLQRWNVASAVKPLTLSTQLRRLFFTLAPTDCAHDPLGYALPGTKTGPNPWDKVKLVNLSARPCSQLHASVAVHSKEEKAR